jgi:DNA-binding NarL/FixJ family response regulator
VGAAPGKAPGEAPVGGRLRLLIADDHALLLEALALLLQPAGEVVGAATDGRQLLALVEQLAPDLVITDLSMPGLSGFEVLRAIGERPKAPPVLVLTVHTDVGTARAALAAGAAGYVVKSAASTELLAAIAAVRRGDRYVPPAMREALARPPRSAVEQLSARQRAVLEGMAAGRSDKQIAALLGISKRTVTFHKEQLRSRLGVHTPVEMVELLRRMGAEPERDTDRELPEPRAS